MDFNFHSELHEFNFTDDSDIEIMRLKIIIIMVIYKCYFSVEHIALLIKTKNKTKTTV